MLNPWILLGALVALIASHVGVFFYGEHIDALSWKASIAEQKIEATALRSQIIAANADKDAKSAEFARNIDKVTADAKEKNAADAAAAQRSFDEQLHRIAGRRPSCPSTGGVATANSGDSERAAAERRDGLVSEIARDLAEVGKSARDLADYAKVCHAFAIQVGR